MDNLSDFAANSTAEKAKDGSWNVYVNGIYKIAHCTGYDQFEAKEWAYHYIQNVKKQLDDDAGL